MKRYILLAGVNGAGKSTLYQSQREWNLMPRINTDEEARKIGHWSESGVIVQAGKISIQKLNYFFNKGISFNQETTLCGKTIFKNIQKAKKLGYIVEIHYVGVNSIEIAKERIAYRVSQGGHGIPDQDVERRYIDSFQALRKVIAISDLLILYDNSDEFRRFAIYKKGDIVRLSSKVPEWYRQYVL